MELEKAPNLGKVICAKLREAGIEDVETLAAIGAEQAFIRLHTISSDCCINMLFALEGAVWGIRWHHLERLRKEELIGFYQTIQIK
ncbi:MAG: TfoX/Sxy family DNA transformation protein [Dysgonomonas sp.]